MIFAVFDVSVIASRREQVHKMIFCTFIFAVLLQKRCFPVGGQL